MTKKEKIAEISRLEYMVEKWKKEFKELKEQELKQLKSKDKNECWWKNKNEYWWKHLRSCSNGIKQAKLDIGILTGT